MVKEIKHKGKNYFQCEACEMYYQDKEIAQKCEDFCNKFKSCNTELIKHAVQLDKDKVCDVACEDEDKKGCC